MYQGGELMEDIYDSCITQSQYRKKYPLTAAWEAFKDANPGLLDAKSLGDMDPDIYLENRMILAFQAGAAAQRKINETAVR
jgi:hypothetical protein